MQRATMSTLSQSRAFGRKKLPAWLTSIPILAHAPGLRKLDDTIPIEAAVMFAVPNAAILADIWRGALASAETIAYAF